MAKAGKSIDFEKSLGELEALVERMEDGELSLEDALKTYERGVRLSRACQKALDGAEQRIRILSQDADDASDGEGVGLEPFAADPQAD